MANTDNSENKMENSQGGMKRRTLLKALVGVPVLGVFAYELIKKYSYDQEKKSRLIKELGLDNLPVPTIIKKSGVPSRRTI